MKKTKKRMSKILLSLSMAFILAFVMMPIDVLAANYNYSSIATGNTLMPGDVIQNDAANQLNIYDSDDNFDVYIESGESYTLPDVSNFGSYYVLTVSPGTQLCLLGNKAYYNVTVGNGTSNKQKYTKGETVTITANAPAAGKQFKEWTVVSGGVTLADAKSAVTTFEMQDKNVVVTAAYEDIPVSQYNVTVTGGTSDKTKYAKGDTVTITANAPAAGKQFKEWTVVSGGVTLADAKSAVTTFEMPDKDVEVTAAYEDIPVSQYNVTVTGGTSDKTKYAKGDTVTITANAPAAGKQFKEWTVVSGGVTLADAKSAATTFEMLDKDVEVTAAYEDIPVSQYNVTVTGGTSDKTKYAKGDTVTITANAPATGKQFKEWTVVSGGVTLRDAKSSKTTFKMLNKDVEVRAVYESVVTPPEPVKPTIVNGNGGVNHQINDGKDMTFTCSGKLENLTGIYVDGNQVDSSNYSLKSGSTILTLKAKYLDTLSAGNHTLKFQYKDNVSAETEFTIIAQKTDSPKTDSPKTDSSKAVSSKAVSPKTGDTSNIMLYISLIVLSGCVAGLGLKKKVLKK